MTNGCRNWGPTMLVGAVILIGTLAGCISESTTRLSRRVVIPEGKTYELAERREDLPDSPLITQTSMASSISVQALGTIPFDGFSLPVCSTGSGVQLVVTQTGTRPTLDMLLGANTNDGADCGISIYRCQDGTSPELVRSHVGGILLGRNANSDGCLVERLNPDGSRWIGLAPWDGGEIRWLVRNANINAFGWINEDGSLAYSSRRGDEERFRVVVRRRGEEPWALEEGLPYSWTFPTLVPSGTGLFALRLGDGFADLAWGSARSDAAFRETLELHRTSDRVDALRAWRTLSGTRGGAGVTENQLAWFSSELRRLVLWKPEARETSLFPGGTLAAARTTDPDQWLITSDRSLELAAMLQTTVATSLVFADPWTALPGTDGDSIILRATDVEGEIELARLRTSPFEPEAEPKAVEDRTDETNGDMPTRRGDPRRD